MIINTEEYRYNWWCSVKTWVKLGNKFKKRYPNRERQHKMLLFYANEIVSLYNKLTTLKQPKYRFYFNGLRQVINLWKLIPNLQLDECDEFIVFIDKNIDMLKKY